MWPPSAGRRCAGRPEGGTDGERGDPWPHKPRPRLLGASALPGGAWASCGVQPLPASPRKAASVAVWLPAPPSEHLPDLPWGPGAERRRRSARVSPAADSPSGGSVRGGLGRSLGASGGCRAPRAAVLPAVTAAQLTRPTAQTRNRDEVSGPLLHCPPISTLETRCRGSWWPRHGTGTRGCGPRGPRRPGRGVRSWCLPNRRAWAPRLTCRPQRPRLPARPRLLCGSF